MTNTDELNTITEPIKEANWKGLQTMFKKAIVTTVAAGLLLAGYVGGEYLTNQKYRYTSYVDSSTVDIAKDMQAICDQRKVCNKAEIVAKFQRNASEALVMDMVEEYGKGKP